MGVQGIPRFGTESLNGVARFVSYCQQTGFRHESAALFSS